MYVACHLNKRGENNIEFSSVTQKSEQNEIDLIF